LALGPGDVVQHGGGHDGVAAPVRAAGAQRRVGADLDALLPAQLPQLPLLPHRVHLHLHHGGRDGGEGEQGLELLAGEVADPDGLGEAQAGALLHGLPHRRHVERHEVVGGEGAPVPPRLHGDGPVDQVQVHVLHLKVPVHSLPECGEHPVAVGVAAPELGRDEELGAGGDHAGPHGLGGGLADGRLRLVVRRGVEVAVPGPDGPEHG
uniref:Uncharacterized protein n=1 Tax=Oryza brachyantha TaxID=4533 RepID=J3LLS2_ORYBR